FYQRPSLGLKQSQPSFLDQIIFLWIKRIGNLNEPAAFVIPSLDGSRLQVHVSPIAHGLDQLIFKTYIIRQCHSYRSRFPNLEGEPCDPPSPRDPVWRLVTANLNLWCSGSLDSFTATPAKVFPWANRHRSVLFFFTSK